VLEKLAEGIGVEDVNVVDAFDIDALESTIKRCVENDNPSVVIVRGPCPLNVRPSGTPFEVDPDECIGCFDCLELGCPAISVVDDIARIDAGVCVGTACGICAQVCPQEAISEIKQ